MTGIGLLIGLMFSVVLTRFLHGQLLGVTPLDVPTYVAVALLLVVIAASELSHIAPETSVKHDHLRDALTHIDDVAEVVDLELRWRDDLR